MEISKYQNFDIITIKRNEIKNAPYNPRVIEESARKRLKKGLKRFGLVELLVWNKRTGNLVSGHQRLSIMDELEKSKDYDLTVSAIDIDEKSEMELNIQMNNTSMMGDYDLDMLGDMINDGIDVNSLGFSESDIDIMFGDSDLVEMFVDSSEASETKEKLKEIKKDRTKLNEQAKKDNDASYYFIVVCESSDEREELFNKMGVPFSEEFVNSDMLKRL